MKENKEGHVADQEPYSFQWIPHLQLYTVTPSTLGTIAIFDTTQTVLNREFRTL